VTNAEETAAQLAAWFGDAAAATGTGANAAAAVAANRGAALRARALLIGSGWAP
jgi:hypothetical protein